MFEKDYGDAFIVIRKGELEPIQQAANRQNAKECHEAARRLFKSSGFEMVETLADLYPNRFYLYFLGLYNLQHKLRQQTVTSQEQCEQITEKLRSVLKQHYDNGDFLSQVYTDHFQGYLFWNYGNTYSHEALQTYLADIDKTVHFMSLKVEKYALPYQLDDPRIGMVETLLPVLLSRPLIQKQPKKKRRWLSQSWRKLTSFMN